VDQDAKDSRHLALVARDGRHVTRARGRRELRARETSQNLEGSKIPSTLHVSKFKRLVDLIPQSKSAAQMEIAIIFGIAEIQYKYKFKLRKTKPHLTWA
jgi:hypothetical protein